MKYYLVGNPGKDIVAPGEGTLIRECRNLFGQRRWSYFYSAYADGTPCLTWSVWQKFDMVKGGKYPASREVSKAVALLLIGRLKDRRKGIDAR
jgi:hypothetical protein